MTDLHFPNGKTLPDFTLVQLVFVLCLTALGYAVATYGMKLFTQMAGPLALGLIGFGLVVAVICEIALLRRVELSTGYIFIIAAETMLVVIVAMSFGEAFDLRKLMGMALVVAGLLVVS